MRSLLAAVIISTYLFAPSVAVPLDDVYHNSPDYHQFQRRADTKACNKQGLPFEYNIRRSPLSNDYDTQTGPSDCEAAGLVKHNGATGGWGLPLLTRARSAFQVYKGDNYKHMTTLDDEAVGLGTHICDHVLEIQVVKSILEEPNGVCELAAKRIKDSNNDAAVIADVKAKLYNIVGILNGPRNLVFLSTEVEKLKGEAVIYASGGGANPIVNTGKGKKKRGPGYWKPGGVNDYLELKTKAWSTDVAGDIDAAIRRDFAEESSGTTVKARWSAILSTIKSETSKVQRDAQNEINKATCEAPTAGGSKFVNRDVLVPLYATTTLGSGSGFDVFSSLTARAAAVAVRAGAGRGGVKSGPKAPPGQSCPLKNQPQKKVLPRSQVKTKPKPATKPRVPTQHPAPRQPNARKKVVPRPANRAKRQVGKPAQPKRTTPKRVPKTVPKPTRRPKGTPRQRCRRR